MRQTRRDILRTAALGSLAIAAGVDNVFGQTSQTLPNILFIMADDLGYADVGCYGRPDLKTPNIDHIAARGVRFTQGYANSAVCSATRSSPDAINTGFALAWKNRLPHRAPGVSKASMLSASHPSIRRCLRCSEK